VFDASGTATGRTGDRFEVTQGGESLLHDAVITAAGEVRHERHAAGFMLIDRVIQTRRRTSTESTTRPCK
jgi:hypothetical protein